MKIIMKIRISVNLVDLWYAIVYRNSQPK